MLDIILIFILLLLLKKEIFCDRHFILWQEAKKVLDSITVVWTCKGFDLSLGYSGLLQWPQYKHFAYLLSVAQTMKLYRTASLTKY